MGEDVWGVEDAVFYMLASDHVLEAKKDELGEFLKYFFHFLGGSRCILGGTFVKIPKVTTLVATLLLIALTWISLVLTLDLF